eukprot:TRINITY_DN27104_c0_g1_i1.p1 TRINITY_DN27104_c0_g1~~TRINITY_DN27104_c0_g1_i1.p1  ORF type:complete len:754 (+),score=103.00 TRINITY_DN27104_c0_g1_i1:76-2337(+)
MSWHSSPAATTPRSPTQSQNSTFAFGEEKGVAFENFDEESAKEPLIPHVGPAGWADDKTDTTYLRGPLNFVEANWFKLTVGGIILLNSITLLAEYLYPDLTEKLRSCDKMFLVLYCVELSLRVGHWQGKFFHGSQEAYWNCFDMLIVVCGILEELHVVEALQRGAGDNPSALMVFRALRPLRLVARLVRFMRLIRLLRVFLTADFSWVESALLQSAVGGIIVFNAIIMGLETDIESKAWDWVEQFLLIFFVLEAALRIRHRGVDFFTNAEDGGWNILDFAIVCSGVVDDWLIQAWSAMTSTGSNQKGSSLRKVMNLARLMRLMRILRLVRVARSIRPLYMLAIGIVRAMQSMFWVLVLTSVALYAMAILTTRAVGKGQMLADPDDIPEKTRRMFGSITESMFTLFAFMNNQQWHTVKPLLDLMPWTKFVFVVFTIYSSWALLSVMTGVVSDHIQYVREVQRQEDEDAQDERQDIRVRTLSQIFSAADTDGSGALRRDAYMEILNSPFQVRRLQKAVNLHVEDIKQIFDLLDFDGNGTVKFSEFCESLDWLAKPVTGRRLLKVDLGVKLVSSQVQQRVAEAKRAFHKFSKDQSKQHYDVMSKLGDYLRNDPALATVNGFQAQRSLSFRSDGTAKSNRSESSFGKHSHDTSGNDSGKQRFRTQKSLSGIASQDSTGYPVNRFTKSRSFSFVEEGDQGSEKNTDPRTVAGLFQGRGRSPKEHTESSVGSTDDPVSSPQNAAKFKKSLSWGRIEEVG